MIKLLDYLIKKFDGVMIDDYGWEHYKVKDKDYDIRFDRSRMEWACDCLAFTYRHKFKKKYCKHILEIQDINLARRSGRAGARVV
ncbi:uncharacterized protein METZ01_LOCUS292926 [marine metagenome]|uniref:SWIM-type domain-containing protein n=1 Tax=marine metagenome TaxID=408172 RepID=A0A382LYC1_9ZZZZ